MTYIFSFIKQWHPQSQITNAPSAYSISIDLSYVHTYLRHRVAQWLKICRCQPAKISVFLQKQLKFDEKFKKRGDKIALLNKTKGNLVQEWG